MGLLDDAIREHLELKRRRGADPPEIERAEREALGPVRRAPEPVDPAAFPGSVGAAERTDQHAPEREPDWEEARYHEGLASQPLARAADDEPFRVSSGARTDDLGPGPDPTEDDAVQREPPRRPFEGEAGAETIEYALEDHGEGEGEDMLEETPEFLQDAPEHDRLWFEQRPPRDFDFNE